MSGTERNQDEIVARIEAIRDEDVFGFAIDVLVGYLDFDHARPFLKQGCTRKTWEGFDKPPPPREAALDYLPFGWEKANNNRGISANRTITKMVEWFWLMGDDEFAEALGAAMSGGGSDLVNGEYQFYGKPQLVAISERLSFDWRSHDDDRWVNNEMAEYGASADRVLGREKK